VSFGGCVVHLLDGRRVDLSHLTAEQALRKLMALGITPGAIHYTETVLTAGAFATAMEFERDSWICDPAHFARTN
jgi:hypothetical protein